MSVTSCTYVNNLDSFHLPEQTISRSSVVYSAPEVHQHSSTLEINDLLCYYTNAQSFINKYDEFVHTMITADSRSQIIGITESWCNKDVIDSEINIDGYTLYQKDRSGSKGGGVLLYVDNNLKSVPLNSLNLHTFNDAIWCEINVDREHILIGVCYRSTSSNEVNNRDLCDMIGKAASVPNMTHVVIMGDFNYPSISWDNANINLSADSELFYEVINDNLLVQHMPFNTRFREGNIPSKLDLLFTNEEEMIEDVKSIPALGRRGNF